MKIRIEILSENEQEEIVIRCRQIDGRVMRLQRFIGEENDSAPQLTFYKRDQSYYLPLEDILFFDTQGENVYAHTHNDMYRVKYRLYELENMLPRAFIRVAKATILNIRHVYSVRRNVAASSTVQFQNSHKQVFVSRYYYKELKQRLEERGLQL